MKKICIKTERLLLKNFSEEEIPYLKKLLRDPDVMRFSPKGPYTDEKALQDRIDEMLKNRLQEVLVSVWLADQWIGFCGLFKWEERWDFGYRFFKEFWGKGYATEAVRAFIDYLKKQAPRENIFCCVQMENLASIRVAEKCGMRYVGKDIFRGLEVVKYRL